MNLRDRIVEAAMELTRIVGERSHTRFEECEIDTNNRCYYPGYDDEPPEDSCDSCKRNHAKKPLVGELAKQRKAAAARLYRLCRRLAREEERA